jgi:biotin carboxylase
MPKTILIVGAGFGQLPAIEKAKELGHKVIVVDKNPYALGMPLADIAITVDIVDIDEVVAVAKQYHVDGVMTMQSDIAVPAVGAVVDALNLSGVGLVVANRCSNKIEARERFKNAGVPQPAFQVITTMQEAQKAVEKIGLPCVIKAPDSSGSRGVVKVCKTSEIESAFQEAKQYSRIGKLLVEEFIDGEEIGAQTFSLNGKCVKVLVHNDTISEPPYMVPIGHSFPAHLPGDIIAKVETACAKAVDAIGINSGPANVDLILGEDGRPMIIEIGARIGATCLPELVKYHTGIDWVEQTIKNCLEKV